MTTTRIANNKSEARILKRALFRLCQEHLTRDKKEGQNNINIALVMLGLIDGFEMDKNALEELILTEYQRNPQKLSCYLIMICDLYGLGLNKAVLTL